jgi:hypothetical protein
MRDLEADLLRRSGQPYLFTLYIALCLSGASDWEGTLIRELGPESLARYHLFPRNLFRTVGEEEGYVSGIGNISLISPALTFDSDEIATMGADEAPHSDSTMVIVGVDLNHRSPGYEPGGMDLATLPRFRHNTA